MIHCPASSERTRLGTAASPTNRLSTIRASKDACCPAPTSPREATRGVQRCSNRFRRCSSGTPRRESCAWSTRRTSTTVGRSSARLHRLTTLPATGVRQSRLADAGADLGLGREGLSGPGLEPSLKIEGHRLQRDAHVVQAVLHEGRHVATSELEDSQLVVLDQVDHLVEDHRMRWWTRHLVVAHQHHVPECDGCPHAEVEGNRLAGVLEFPVERGVLYDRDPPDASSVEGLLAEEAAERSGGRIRERIRVGSMEITLVRDPVPGVVRQIRDQLLHAQPLRVRQRAILVIREVRSNAGVCDAPPTSRRRGAPTNSKPDFKGTAWRDPDSSVRTTPHSALSATTGSTPAARRAGTKHIAVAYVIRIPPIDPLPIGSVHLLRLPPA